MIPSYSNSIISSGPYIVCVFPDDVYPYAKIVPLNPSSTLSITGCAENPYTSA
jgi:hypothetical protein